MVSHKLMPFEKQDKLEEGLVRIDDGSYVGMSNYYDKIGRHLKTDTECVFRDLDETEAERATSDCFIATAVYGDVNAPEVQALRQFRNNVLSESRLGRMVINLYYGGLGRRIADTVKQRMPSAIPVIKRGLDYLIRED
ncbi:MAG: CFI-box-CTERM domain-containing protein [Candidatus Woesearchaeota archaeon]